MRPSVARVPSSLPWILRRPCTPFRPPALPSKAALYGFSLVSPLRVSLGSQVRGRHSGSQHRWAFLAVGGGTAWGRRDGDRWPQGAPGAAIPRQPPLGDGDLEVPSKLTLGYRDTQHSSIQTRSRRPLPAGENHRLFFQLSFLIVC